MHRYVMRRLGTFLLTVWLAASLSFVALLILPGNPAQIILGTDANPGALTTLRAQLGLDLPAPTRYVHWLADTLRLDLGTSLIYDVPVDQLMAERLQVTLPLAGLALGFAMLLGIPLGLAAAYRRNSWLDVGISGFSQLGMATPSFWLGMALVLLFAVRWRLLPASGFTPWDVSVPAALRSLMLPAVALGVARAASLTRIVRSATLEVMHADFVRTARAKGVPEGRLMTRHVLRNAFISIGTVLALEIAQLLAGAIIVENVFALPGLGSLVLTAVTNRDLPLVQGIVVSMATFVVFISFATDIVYAYVDPRIRYA